MIYFIKAVHSNAIKIGFSNDPKARLASLQTGSAEPLELLGVIPGQIPDEKRLHGQFARYRMAGEWFKGAPELVRAIESILQPSLDDLVMKAHAHYWLIDGIAMNSMNEEDQEGLKLFCVIRGSKPAFPDPDEMLSAVWPAARFFLCWSISMVSNSDAVTALENIMSEDDELRVHRALSDKEFLTWVVRVGRLEGFRPVLPRGIRQAETIRPQAHPTDSIVVGSGVLHPQYGLGQVLAIDGKRPERKARIRFTVGGEKTFILAKSPLRPVALPAQPNSEAETEAAPEAWKPRWMNPSNS